ncbi:MAG: tetratricopeptide repeat protein, partial [Planctomycetes bacterium]|nr:tetratricopeptide repeat protein [Planctomycetota bacterium]
MLGAPPSGELLSFLTEKTAGHPYYLEELLRYLRDEHLVEGSPARLSASLGPLPDSLTALLTAQLDALPAEARRVMKSASVVGRTFWLRLLERLVERESADAVEVARRRDIVISQDASLLPGDPQFSFRHALLKDAAYALLTRRERARLHGLAAGLLESRVAEGGRRIRALAARHREAAGQPAEAGALWLSAAREAADAHSSAEAYEYAREAERLAPGPESAYASARSLNGLSRNSEAVAAATRAEAGGGDLATDARLLRSRALVAMGQFAPSIEAAREAAATATGERLARALTQESLALRLVGKLPESLDRARAALSALDAPESPPAPERDRIRVEALLAIARTHRSSAAFPEAEAAAREALELAVSRGDAAGENVAWGTLGDLHRTQGRGEESLRCYERVLPWRLAMGDRRGAAVCRSTMGSACNTLGRSDEAIAHYREALPVLREVGDNFNAAWCLQGEALAIGKSDPARAATLLDEAARAFRDSGSPAGLASVLHIASQIRFRLGDFPAARRLALEAVEEFRRVGEKPSLTVALNTLGAALRATGDLDGAARAHRESIDTSLDPRVSAASHEELSVTLEDSGDLAGAIRECEATTSLTERRGDPKHLAGSLGRLSSLMALTGAHAAAEALLRTRASLLG